MVRVSLCRQYLCSLLFSVSISDYLCLLSNYIKTSSRSRLLSTISNYPLVCLHIHLVEVPPFCCCNCDHGANGSHLCHWGKGLFVIDPVCLFIPFCHKQGLVPIDGVLGIVLHLVYPSASDCLLMGVKRGWDPMSCFGRGLASPHSNSCNFVSQAQIFELKTLSQSLFNSK